MSPVSISVGVLLSSVEFFTPKGKWGARIQNCHYNLSLEITYYILRKILILVLRDTVHLLHPVLPACCSPLLASLSLTVV